MTVKIVTTNIHSQFLYPELTKVLSTKGVQVSLYDEKRIYSDDTVFSIAGEIRSDEYKKFLNHRIIVEYQGESNSGNHGSYFMPNHENILFVYGCHKNSDASNIVFYPNFFWHDLALDYKKRRYDTYRPNKTYKKKFLMPIRNWKGQAAWRREVFDQLQDIIPDSIYSMFEDGIYLPGSHKKSDRREINYSWFDDTFFSLTLESYYDPEKPIFPTEKIFKPLAFWHPFLVISSPKFLQNLRDNGFETFENLFDESYDNEVDIHEKIKIIKKNVFEYGYKEYDKRTLGKLRHNQNHFYDMNLIMRSMETDFIDPVLKWLE